MHVAISMGTVSKAYNLNVVSFKEGKGAETLYPNDMTIREDNLHDSAMYIS